jgi:hypothetical protein
MSTIFDIESAWEKQMTIEEKGVWIYGILAVVVPIVYFVSIGGQIAGRSASEIDYASQLLTAIGAAIVLAIVANIIIAILSPKEAGMKDERDRRISHLGERVGFYVLGVLVLAPLALALLRYDQFWIANSIYLASVLAAVASAAVRVVAYRRGF